MDTPAVQEQLHRLKELLSVPTTDLVWQSRYSTSEEAISDLELLEKGVLNNDQASVDELLFLLAPTGSLQEISISSGWGQEFLDIAAALELELGAR